MKVVVIGVGHVGLVTAATLAHFGHDVVGLDDDLAKIEAIKRGGMPFFEPGLPQMVETVTGSGKLSFATDYPTALTGAELAMICVGTPAAADGEANLAAVESAALAAAKSAGDDLVLVQKSTVPVRTADRLKRLFRNTGPGKVHLAANPEFLREGGAVQDSMNPDRILVGADDDEAHRAMRELYRPLIAQGTLYFATDIKTAELAKHACNAFLALKISFANALARICEASGADVQDIADIMGSDARIGRAFLNPGLGYGGYCLPKDVAAFKSTAGRLGYDFGLLNEVMYINKQALSASFEKIKECLWNLEGKKILLLGLAYKAGTDDVRESPSINLAGMLMEAGASVIGHDPHANNAAKAELPELQVADDPYEAADGAHCIVLCTSAPEFAQLDLVRLKGVLTNPVIVDIDNVLDAELAGRCGFTYIPTGKPPINL